MGTSGRNHLKITSAMIVKIIFLQLITLTYGSILPESNLDTPSKISTIISQNISKHETITDQEIKTILHQFNEVNDDFKTLEEIFDLQSNEYKSRKIRSTEKPQKCEISKDALTNLKNEIERQVTQVTGNLSTCSLNPNNLDYCKESIKVFQCVFKHLNDSTTSGIDSIDKIIKWNYVYANLFVMYTRVIGQLKQNLSLEEYQLELSKLKAYLRQSKAMLFLAINKLEIALDRLQNYVIDISVSEIMEGDYEEAADNLIVFKLIPVPISRIIKQSYRQNSENDLRNFESIINFIERQQTDREDKIPNDVIAFETLYNQMELKNHLNSSKVLLLARAIKNSPAKDKLTSLYSKIELQSNEYKSRKIRSVGKPQKCEISKDALTSLKNEIDRQVTQVTGNLSTCILNPNNLDYCNESIKVFQCVFKHLNDSDTSGIDSIDKIIKWNYIYGNLFVMYTRIIGQLKQNLSLEEYQLELNKFKAYLRQSKAILFLAVNKLEIALDRLQNYVIDISVSEILEGEYEDAANNLYEFRLIPVPIFRIIKESYDRQNGENDLRNFKSIINFIERQHTNRDDKIRNDVIAFETLYNQMELKNHLNSSKVILLARAIENSPAKDKLTSLYSKIELQSKEYKSRKIRSTGKPQDCIISKDGFTSLKNEIERRVSQVTDNLSTCSLNPNNLDYCKESIKVIQCGLKHLNDSAKPGFDSIDKIIKWNYVYEKLFGMYEKLIEYLKKSLSLEEYQEELYKFKDYLRQGKVKLFLAVNKLEIALERLQYSIIDICVSEIMEGEYKEAADNLIAFKLIPAPISRIIKQSYDLPNGRNDLRNFQSIINFIERQQTGREDKIPNDVIAFKTLYNQMELKNHLNSSKVILLARAIKNSPAKDKLSSLYSKIELQSNEYKSRKIRSVGKPKECQISKDALTNLKNVIDRQVSLVTGNLRTCTLNPNNLDYCKESIKVIQCGFKHLNDSATPGIDSIDKIIKWIYAYENLFQMYKKLIEYLKQSSSQEYQQELYKLKADLRQGKSILFLAVNKLEIALDRLQNYVIDISVLEINNGEYEEAADNLFAFKLITVPIFRIIKQSYDLPNDRNDLRNFQSIINFIERQQMDREDKISNDVIAFETLYNQMELKNHLNSSRVILLARAIKNSPAKDKLTSLSSKIEEHLNNIKISWADLIYNNRHDDELKNFAGNWNEYFQEILSDILIKALKMPNALTENFDNILKFIRNELPYSLNAGIAYKTLLHEIKRQGQINNFAAMPKLAYNIKAWEMPNYLNYDGVQVNIPSWAYKLIWQGDKCKLKNRNRDQYLYAAGEEFVYELQRRRVFSGQASILKSNTEEESQWKFVTQDKGETFMIRNRGHWNECLYAYKDWYGNDDQKPNQVFTDKHSIIGIDWKITPIDNGTYVIIQNNRNEYLYVENVDENDNLKSRVFTRKLGGTPNNKESLTSSYEWELQCDVNTNN